MMLGWDYEPADDRFGNFWNARYLQGEDQMLYWSDFDTISTDFSLALWFKTTTVKGGVIAGFFDSPWNKTKMEAMLYMTNNGKLHFRLSNGGTPSELTTSYAYNDGVWHYVLIQHSKIMTLEVDDGTEKITSAFPVSKERFKGYWTFGGPALPGGVPELPASLYFKGAIDDILCLDEANRYITPYVVRQPVLAVSVAGDMPACAPSAIDFELPFSQAGVEYRVLDRLRSIWGPVSAIGDGGRVQFGSSEVMTGINEFVLIAKDLSTGCETLLDTVFVTDLLSVCTSLPDNQEENNLEVYPVPADDFIRFRSGIAIKEVIIIDLAGRIVHRSRQDRNIFEINTSGLPGSVYFYKLVTEDNKTLTGRVLIL